MLACVFSVSLTTPRHLTFLTFFINTNHLERYALLTPLCFQFLASVWRPLSEDLSLFWTHCLEFITFIPQSLQNGCVTRLVCWWAFGCSSPCAFNPHRWLASCSQHRERESRVSVFPCQYIAYPQQVLCSAFSRLQVSMGAARPQNRTARAKLA